MNGLMCWIQVLQNFASIASIVGAIAAILVVWQVWEMKKARMFDSFRALFADMSEQQFRLDKRFVFTELPSDPQKASREDVDRAESVWIRYCHVGEMVKSGLLPKDLTRKMYSDDVVKVWKILEPYIEWQKTQRNEPGYAEAFVDFAKSCVEYRKSKFPGEDLRTFVISPKENSGRFALVSNGSTGTVYIPGDIVRDSTFPFKDGDKLHVKIEKDRLIVEKIQKAP